MSVTRVAAAAAVICVSFATACGSPAESGGGSERHVYISVPLRGAGGGAGQAIADGALLALADAGGEAGGLQIKAEVLDNTEGAGPRARWTPVKVGENARTATEDASAIAYIGELDSAATRTSLPITNLAGLAQVSAASTAVDLTQDTPGTAGPRYQQSSGRTFARVIPDAEVVREAANAWARELGANVEVAPEGAGLSSFAADTVDASANPAARPTVYFTSSAQAPQQLAAPLGREFAAAFEAEYGHAPDRYAAYGYEAMALVLDAISRASDPGSRGAVVEALFATQQRDSVLGEYSIDREGNTTLRSVSGYVVEKGRATYEAALEGE